MNIGLVIGTYGTPCYVHMNLDAATRFCPDVPLLVHDDSSPESEELSDVCSIYGASFASTSASRAGPLVGDLLSVIAGLEWAEQNNFDVLVKFSRRYIPLFNWKPALEEAVENAGETRCLYGANSPVFGHGPIRSEAVGFNVRKWFDEGKYQALKDLVEDGGDQAEFCLPRIAKGHYHWSSIPVRMADLELYPTLWYFHPGYQNYLAFSQDWGLPYTAEDFETAKMSL